MKNVNNRPIGIFDSGIGGLTVLREIEKLLPGEDLIYFGDTARVPYGTKSADTVIRYSLQIAEFLKTKKIKMLVVGCNTASAYAITKLQQKLSFPVSGVIVAGVKAALAHTRNGNIAVIGTEGTIGSGSYKKILMNKKSYAQYTGKKISYIGKACPLFVPLVEEGWLNGHITEDIARTYLKTIRSSGCDTIILGCTHYPLLKKVINKVLGKNISIVDSAEETAGNVFNILHAKSMVNPQKNKGKRMFYVSDSPDKFCRIGQLFLKKKIEQISLVRLD
ncbi:MAG: glutamate racemase [bacterium]